MVRQFRSIWSLGLLLCVGVVDLATTAMLYHMGLIREMNPLMRVFLDHSVAAFIIAKGVTLAVASVVMWRHARHDPKFVFRACLYGSAAYICVWLTWFNIGRL
ncbi:MAG: hypothetical protein JSS72_10585 [Armatimonadetes bacterium]|nr:hypothetical protein [Armatimonadota bacterium]